MPTGYNGKILRVNLSEKKIWTEEPGQFESARGAPGPIRQWMEHARAAVAGAWARVVSVGPVAFLRWLESAGTALVVEFGQGAVAKLLEASSVIFGTH